MAANPVAIITESAAQRLFPKGDPLNHHIAWTDPILKVVPILGPQTQRIIGIVADIDDTHVVPQPIATVYHPFAQQAVLGGGRLFVHVSSNPYALVLPIRHIMRAMSADQPVERAATLEDVRAEVLSTDRLNAMVFGFFAAVALLIAVVGVSGVLAFSVSGRTREFGIRLAIGSQPRRLLLRVIAEGVNMAIAGLGAGCLAGYILVHFAANFLSDLKTPDILPIAASAAVLFLAPVTASVIPAARAARVDVMQALRSE